MTGIGILAYGSLINDPGVEIGPLIVHRIPTTTPFPVEYARLSSTRGGSPTVVPHTAGKPVKAVVLMLSEVVFINEAKNLLWRRETRMEESGRVYHESPLPNAVVIRNFPGFCDFEHVLYTDFNQSGKLSAPVPKVLAEAAVKSVTKAKHGEDGISYLINLITAGVETALTEQYQNEILALTSSSTLADALSFLRSKTQGG